MPRLVHEREVGIEHLGEANRLLGAARVGRDGDDVVAGQAEVAEVAREQRDRRHVVDRDHEEALDLPRVQVHREDAVGAGELQHVGDEARRDRLARLRLPVLPRVREQRDDRGDALGRGELRGLDHEEQLHDVLVDGLASGLHDEDVGAADRLVVADVRLAVRERADLGLAELDAELLRDALGEVGVRPPGEDHQALLRAALDPVARRRLRHDGRFETGKDELRTRAHGLHIPPCSPASAARTRVRRRGRLSL